MIPAPPAWRPPASRRPRHSQPSRRQSPSTPMLGISTLRAAVTVGRRLADRCPSPVPVVDLGPAPADGFTDAGNAYWTRKGAAEEQARDRAAYETGRLDARRERLDRFLAVTERAATGHSRRGRR